MSVFGCEPFGQEGKKKWTTQLVAVACLLLAAKVEEVNVPSTIGIQNYAIPVALVENSGRCNKNEYDEKILPTDSPWIPNLVCAITEMTLNGKKSILVVWKLIEGPNLNDRGKLFIPVILAFQYFFVIKTIEKWIRKDVF